MHLKNIIYRSGAITGSLRSIELLRQNLQKFISEDLAAVLHGYVTVFSSSLNALAHVCSFIHTYVSVQDFFEPALKNVKENCQDEHISSDLLNRILQTALEEVIFHSLKSNYRRTVFVDEIHVSNRTSEAGFAIRNSVLRRWIGILHKG